MTIFTRYVNTASTLGGNGTTNATTGANRAYPDLYRALNLAATTIADGDEWIFECCGTAADTYNPVDTSVFTISGTGKLTIGANRSDTSGFYSGPLAYSTAHYRLEVASGLTAILAGPRNVTIDGLQVAATGNPTYLVTASHFDDASANNIVKNCRLKGNGSTGIGLYLFNGYRSYSPVSAAHNNIITGFAKGVAIDQPYYATTISVYCYNNTIVNCTTGMYGGSITVGTVWVRNNACSNCTTAVTLSASGSGTIHTNYNAYDTGQAGNATGTAVSDWTTAFTDPSGGDYSVKSGSPLIGGGVSAAADSQVPGQDLLGRARAPGACDLGVFSFVTQTAQEPVWSALSFV